MSEPPTVPPPQPSPHYPPPQPPPPSGVVGKTAIGTLTVLLTLVGVCCGIPLLILGVMALLGQVGTIWN